MDLSRDCSSAKALKANGIVMHIKKGPDGFGLKFDRLLVERPHGQSLPTLEVTRYA
jgi:hypothetical protein